MRKSLGATIQDVARLAGVSPASVSKVFNDAPNVSAETRQAVLDAAARLSYRPNNAARSLRAGRSHTIGVITDDIEGVFTTSLVRGLEEIARARDYSVILTNSYGDPALERTHIEVLAARQIDGIVLMSGYNVHERGEPARPLDDLPVVYLYQYTQTPGIPSVIPDDEGGGYLGARYLLDIGHRRIGVINGPPSYSVTVDRLTGYRRALREAGVAFDAELIQAGEWTVESGYDRTYHLMHEPNPPTAIFCMSDLLALGAADALREMGRMIPDDVSLVGFDDRFFAKSFRPPLTTVALPLNEMGETAGKLLIAMISGETVERQIINIPCRLIERGTAIPYKASSRS